MVKESLTFGDIKLKNIFKNNFTAIKVLFFKRCSH